MKAANVIFLVACAACLLPLFNPPHEALAFLPPAALLGGLVIALTLGNPYPAQSKQMSRTLLQASVVLLGFTVDLRTILAEGIHGLGFALLSILGVFALGALLQRWLRLPRDASLLVSAGTAICGGSAIAAVASVLKAEDEDVSVALGTVFVLNAIALLAFPPLGHLLGLTPAQFGTWSGIAIHDVASVVGAATAYGGTALDTATVVKLSRVLYLFPVVLVLWVAMRRGTSSKPAPPPAFIGLFILASLLGTYVEPLAALKPSLRLVAASGFALSLFLIGTGVSLKSLRAVGPRPLLQGLLLWVFISVAGLFAVRSL